MDIVAWLSSQADINLVHVDFSVVMFFRNSSPGNIQTFRTLRSHQNLTRSNRGNWKIEKKTAVTKFFPLKILLRNLLDTFLFFPKGFVCDLSKIAKSQFFCKIKS